MAEQPKEQRSLVNLDMFYHESDSRETQRKDAFARWTSTLPATHWARYDLSACALGWNAAIHAISAYLNPQEGDQDEIQR